MTAAGLSSADLRPNILFIFADGWGRYAGAYEEIEGPQSPYEELYDLSKDPDYMTNVAEHPDDAAIKKKLGKELMDTLVAEKDPRVVENPVRFEHPPYTDPHGR